MRFPWLKQRKEIFPLSEEELLLVRKFALGEKELKQQAIEIYWKGLANGLHWHSCPEMGYMY